MTFDLKNILMPLNLSPVLALDTMSRARGICGIRSRRFANGVRVLTNGAYSPNRPALSGGATAELATNERLGDSTSESLATRIGLHPFFVGMNRRQLAMLADCATAVQFEEGQVIFRENEPADRFYLVETGKVAMESSEGLADPRLGWSWMFPPHIRNFTARAVGPVTAIYLEGATLREYCEKDHFFGYELLKRMSLVMYQRAQAARDKTLAIHQNSDTLQLGEAVAA